MFLITGEMATSELMIFLNEFIQNIVTVSVTKQMRYIKLEIRSETHEMILSPKQSLHSMMQLTDSSYLVRLEYNVIEVINQ